MIITSKITKQKLTEYSHQKNIRLRDIKDVHSLDLWKKEFFVSIIGELK